MKRKNPNKNEVAAEWATSLEPDARKFFGSITIEPDLRIHFPILKGHGDIPFGTTVFWGVRDNLERCTAITLPSGPAGSHTGPTGHSLFLDGIVTHLLIGRVHVPDPSAQFVKKLIFTPHPNSSLHVLRLLEWIQPKKDILDVTFASDCEPNRKAITTSHSAYFVPERGPLFNIAIPQAKATVTAWIGGNLSGILEEGSQSRISFGIDFEDLQHLDSALDEANRLCTFLSFTAHQYIYPSDFRIVLENEQAPIQLINYSYVSEDVTEPFNSWVKYTLLCADENADEFSKILGKWYAGNDELLRSRYQYRNSLREPNVSSPERFLAIFQALEGILPKSGYKFLNADEFSKITDALSQALPGHTKLNALIGKLRSNNVASLKFILGSELSKLLGRLGVKSKLDLPSFIDRIYARRTKASHGGSHLDRVDRGPTDNLMYDTRILTIFYLLFECEGLGIDPVVAVKKFNAAHWLNDMPFEAA